jgi:leucyl/phenylalanyl-tRNA--protein transferase
MAQRKAGGDESKSRRRKPPGQRESTGKEGRRRNDAPVISAELLLHAYRNGVFPMGLDDGEIGWFSPDPRAVIPIDERFHVPHGLQRTLKKQLFEIRVNTAFEEVMRACATRAETWIDDTIIASYVNLHRRGAAHSVEAWQEGKLAGGLYGVAIGGAFFGESMFHRVTDASKVALFGLVERLRERRFVLLDTQWTTPHLQRFGAYEMPRAEYLTALEKALKLSCRFAS